MISKQAKQKEINLIKSQNANKGKVSFAETMDSLSLHLKAMSRDLEQIGKLLAKVAVDARKAEKDNGQI